MSNFCVLSHLVLFRETLNRFQLKQISSFYFRERYVNLTCLFIGRVPNTYNFTKNFKFLNIKPFGTVERNSESISIEANILLIFSRKICKFDVSLNRMCSEYVQFHEKRQILEL